MSLSRPGLTVLADIGEMIQASCVEGGVKAPRRQKVGIARSRNRGMPICITKDQGSVGNSELALTCIQQGLSVMQWLEPAITGNRLA